LNVYGNVYKLAEIVMFMNRKGAGHIEFILSVVLFLGVVGFALFFFAPSGGNRTIESSLTYSFKEIIRDVEVEVDSYSVKVVGSQVTSDSIAVQIMGIDGNKKVRVESCEGNVLPSKRIGNIVYFDWMNDLCDGKYFDTIKFSIDFVESTAPSETPTLDTSYYEIASSSSRDIVSESELGRLEDEYEGYNDLKKRFNLEGIDFSFSLSFVGDIEPTIEPEATIPEGLEVFSQSKRIEVLRRDGTLEFADLVVRIW